MGLFDTMLNLVSGLGSDRDKTMGNSFGFRELTSQELEDAYRGDWIARKVVKLPAYDMIRAGRSWQTKKNNIEKIEASEKRLKLWQNLLSAMIKGRLYGGGALIIGGPGRPDEELLSQDVSRGGLKYLYAATRYELQVREWDKDLMSDYFGRPKYYEITAKDGRTARIHPSRVVPFYGNEYPNRTLSTQNDGWSDSVLQAVADAVMNAGAAQQGIAGLIQEAKIDVVKIPQLMEHLATDEYTDRLITRFTLAAQAKSTQNTLMLDSEEEWDRKQINFTQLPDILKLYLNIAAGAADIPATRLLGTSPVGMNATGESDIRQYYDKIAGDQVAELRPSLEWLDELILRDAIGRSPTDVFYIFNPLWQMNDKEKSDIGQKKAQTAKAWGETGLIPPPVLIKMVENQIIEDGLYPGAEAAYEENEGEGGVTAPALDPNFGQQQQQPPGNGVVRVENPTPLPGLENAS
jgi:uncharacterized protein